MARGRPRSDAERQRALAIYEQQGLSAASLQTGIPKATISGWADSNGVRTNEPAQTAAATVAAVRTLALRRACLAEVLLRVAETHVGAVDAGKVDSPRDGQTYMTIAAIAIDKSQLLSGEATVRTEIASPDQAREELSALQQQWRRRAS